jgi:hypothetical protein
MLGFKNNNPDLNLLIQKKISTLSENGECNTIDPEGNLIALRHIAAASSIPTVSVDSESRLTYNSIRNISSNLPPDLMPRTQSGFYMPIITEAYYRAKGLAVPQHILNISGRVINLRQNVINQNTYNKMVEALTAYLREGDNLVKLEYNYRNDKQPNVNNEGHINAREQEDLLAVVNIGGMSLHLLLDHAIQMHYLS